MGMSVRNQTATKKRTGCSNLYDPLNISHQVEASAGTSEEATLSS